MTTIQGVIHGKTIELEKEPGLPDGQAVSVTIQRIEPRPAESKPEDIPRVELWMDRLVFDPIIPSGERIVKGTSLEAEALVTELEQGHSDEEMLQAHPELTQEDVEALRHYARFSVGLRRSFGAWAAAADELDKFIEWTYEHRKLERPPLEP